MLVFAASRGVVVGDGVGGHTRRRRLVKSVKVSERAELDECSGDARVHEKVEVVTPEDDAVDNVVVDFSSGRRSFEERHGRRKSESVQRKREENGGVCFPVSQSVLGSANDGREESEQASVECRVWLDRGEVEVGSFDRFRRRREDGLIKGLVSFQELNFLKRRPLLPLGNGDLYESSSAFFAGVGASVQQSLVVQRRQRKSSVKFAGFTAAHFDAAPHGLDEFRQEARGDRRSEGRWVADQLPRRYFVLGRRQHAAKP